MNDHTPTITVRAGTVLRAGVPIGTVDKISHDGLWADNQRDRMGGTEWVATATDGTTFDGFDTRKAAVARLAQSVEPLTVTNVRWETNHYGRFLSASVSWEGHTALVSRYPSETAWVVDAFFQPGTFFPVWSNGEGSRFTRAHVLKADQAAAVDAEAARLHL